MVKATRVAWRAAKAMANRNREIKMVRSAAGINSIRNRVVGPFRLVYGRLRSIYIRFSFTPQHNEADEPSCNLPW